MSALITTLPDAVDNDFLYKMDEFYLDYKFTEKKSVTLLVKNQSSLPAPGGLRLAGTSNFTNDNNENLGKHLDNVSGSRTVQISAGEGRLFISPQMLISSIRLSSPMRLPVEGFKNTGVADVSISNFLDHYGDKPDLSAFNSPSLKYLTTHVNGSWLSGGSINDLSNLASFVQIALLNQYCSFDLDSAPDMPDLTKAQLVRNNCSGSIAKLSASTGLTAVEFSSPAVTGVVEDLLDALYAGGRVSGSLRIANYGASYTYNGETWSGDKTFNFSSSGWSVET